MPLPAPELDDRRFQDIVDEAKRLIPRYCPEWTNHNVSDPGVALIELFAWMSEMVLFRVNQVPERLYVHFLNMIGIEPFPPAVSRAELTFWLSAVLDQPVLVPAGTQVTTAVSVASSDTPIVFTTTRDLTISPPVLRSAKTISANQELVTDIWDDLRFDPRGAVCFPSEQLTPGDALCLGFEHSLAGTVLRLTLAAHAEGIGVDPRNPPLAWEVWNGEGWIAAAVNQDTTGGLNRDGQITLLIPIEHELMTLGDTPGYWLRVRLVEPTPGQPTYQASPRILNLDVAALGGTIVSEHSQQRPREVLGRSDGTTAQRLTVTQVPVLPRTAGEHVQVIDPDGTADWTEVDDFSGSGPTDRHYVWDSSSGTVGFGPRVRYPDGSVRQHGAIPRDGAEIVVTGYRTGGGARGNVGARTLTVLRSSVPFVANVTNLGPAVGGVDAETVAEAKTRGPLTLRTGQRAVTAGDFERLAKESSIEVARARCLPSTRVNGVVRVLIVPNVRADVSRHTLDSFAITAPLMRQISEHLDAHRLVGSAIEVGTPYYQGVSVVALVYTGAGRPNALVQQRAMDLLARYLNPLTGGPDGNGWPFDADLNSAAVAQLLESVDGVERIEEVLLFEYDLRTGRRIGTAKDVIQLDRDSLFLSAGHKVIVR
ncbi:MAG: putative baseplate assembly protein [Actinomycetia bacterium]|nr:putative baseplate assembly protein [Actinomycetes bacterium]